MARELRTCALAALTCLVPAGAKAHDWYSGLHDKNGVSCCDREHCRPTAMCRLPDGREGIVVFDVCRPIPWRAHVCAVPRNGGRALVLCVVLAGGV